MKIICLIKPTPSLVYFVNRINIKHKVSLVIAEAPSLKQKVSAKFKSGGISGIIDAFVDKILDKMKEKQHIKDYNKYFKDSWRCINSSIPVFEAKSINSQAVCNRLKEEKADLILVHGTSLLTDCISKAVGLTLNLHWGLSPYYRGTHCTEWALINRDPYNIGVTIHKLTKIIDGGDILAQKRAVIRPDDTVNSINMQLTYLGVELILETIDSFKSHQQLPFKRQDYSLGIVTANKQWTRCLRKQIKNIERNNIIRIMIENPACKQQLPIVEL